MNGIKRNKANIYVVVTTLLVTATILYFNVYRFYGYKVSIGTNTITFVKSKMEFNRTYKKLQSEIESKYKTVVTTKDFTLSKVKVDDVDVFISGNNLEKKMLENFNIVVDVFLMKSDNKKMAYVESVNQGEVILKALKDYYYKEAKLGNPSKIDIENKISYETVKVKTSNLQENSEIVKEVIKYNNKAQTPIITVKSVGNKSTEVLVGIKKSTTIQVASISSPSRGNISSNFGMRWGKMHKGIDIAADAGSTINATLDGVVCYAGWEEGYGNVIKIDHGDGIEITYGHCSVINVKKGEAVKSGTKIGEVGSTGNSTGPHLHFEVRENGVAINPEKYLM